MKRYENFVGLTEVKAAQARVVECERKFIDTQDMRREAQVKIADIQKRIKVRFNTRQATGYQLVSFHRERKRLKSIFKLWVWFDLNVKNCPKFTNDQLSLKNY